MVGSERGGCATKSYAAVKRKALSPYRADQHPLAVEVPPEPISQPHPAASPAGRPADLSPRPESRSGEGSPTKGKRTAPALAVVDEVGEPIGWAGAFCPRSVVKTVAWTGIR